MKKLITKKDIIILAFLLIAGTAGIFLMNSGKNGKTAVVYVDGEAVTEIAITNDYYEEQFSGVTVCCENGEIFVKESLCSDKVCIRTGKILKSGECIICAPNKVAIEISGENQLDALTG